MRVSSDYDWEETRRVVERCEVECHSMVEVGPVAGVSRQFGIVLLKCHCAVGVRSLERVRFRFPAKVISNSKVGCSCRQEAHLRLG